MWNYTGKILSVENQMTRIRIKYFIYDQSSSSPTYLWGYGVLPMVENHMM